MLTCTNCRQPIDFEFWAMHQEPCVFCTSDGHASCQHAFEDQDTN